MLTITLITAIIATVVCNYYNYKTVKLFNLSPIKWLIIMNITNAITIGIMLYCQWYWLTIILSVTSIPCLAFGYEMNKKIFSEE